MADTENSKTYCANLAVQSDDQEGLVKAMEVLSRTAIGLTLDSLTVNITCLIIEDEPES